MSSSNRSPGSAETADGTAGLDADTAGLDPDATDGLDPADAEADLGAALAGLARLAVGGQSLEASLTWIASLAVIAIPGAQGAGLTMLEDRHPETVCVSAPFVREVDDIQYGLGEGPCITAAAEARTVVSGALSADPRWPRFGPRMTALGVHSVLSLPLITADGEVMGATNVYAHGPDAFTAEAARQGESFAAAAAVAVHTARELMQARRLSEQLSTALTSRATIDQAIGIVMSRQGGTSDDAFAVLRRLSQNQNMKLTAVAEGLVREAVLRARARRAGH